MRAGATAPRPPARARSNLPLPTGRDDPVLPPDRVVARPGSALASTCARRGATGSVDAVPEVPRLPWRVIAASTVLALLAATATYVLLDGGDDGEASTGSTVTIPLVPDPGTVDPAGAAFTEFGSEEPVLLSSLRGKPVVVNFFASYCVPCITEMPDFEAVHRQVGDEVTFLGLAVADRDDEAQELVQRTGVTYRTARDFRSEVITALGGTLLPTTVLLGADGGIVAVHPGALDADELRDLLVEELGIARPA